MVGPGGSPAPRRAGRQGLGWFITSGCNGSRSGGEKSHRPASVPRERARWLVPRPYGRRRLAREMQHVPDLLDTRNGLCSPLQLADGLQVPGLAAQDDDP